MPRHHARANPAVDTPSLGQELKLFVSALVIGLVLGIGGSALWHQRQVPPVPPELASAVAAQKSCQKNLVAAQKQLSQCQRDLKLEQLKPSAPPAPSFAPALTVSDKAAPTPMPDAAPPIVPEPAPAPTAPLTWPKHVPPAPKPKPGSAVAAPEVLPSAVPVIPEIATPQEPVPPTQPLPTTRVRVPKAKPSVIPPRAAVPMPDDAPSQNLGSGSQFAINVGEEKTLSAEHALRLVAVSKRKTGSYCVVAGNGLSSTRIASGKTQVANWGGSRVTLAATVQDSDTCRVSVRPD